VVVVVPESGDDIQALKAGLLEIADILVVNKSDRPGAQTLRDQLREAVSVRSAQVHGGKMPKVVMTEGINGQGMAELREEIETLRLEQMENGQSDQRRRERTRQALLNLVREEFRVAVGEAFAKGDLPGGRKLEAALDSILEGKENPFQLAKACAESLLGGDASQGKSQEK